MAGTDRISMLPDPLLHHILSSFTTKEIIRSTSTLSKRWDRLWMRAPSLTFDSEDFNDDSKFTRCLDLVFSERKQLKFDSFKLKWFTSTSTFEPAETWLTQVVNAKPRVLVVKTASTTNCCLEFPDDIFECESIEELKLATTLQEGFYPLKPKRVYLKRLKKLKIIGSINLDDNCMKMLMHGSPPLEKLRLGCQYEGLSIVSPELLDTNRLKKLQLRGNITLDEKLMKKILCASPTLEELLLDCKYEAKLSLPSKSVNLEHLKRLQINGDINLDNQLMEELMRGSPVLEELLLGCHYEGLSRISSKSVEYLNIYFHEAVHINELLLPNLGAFVLRNV